MPSKLVFHVGDHKTGSSSIQQVLAKGDIRLEGKTLLYPCRSNHNYLFRHVQAFLKNGQFPPGEPGLPGLRKLRTLMERTEADYTVLSGEEFENAHPEGLARVMDKFLLPHASDHLVLCYLRPHAGRVLSSFVEQTKIGFCAVDLEEYHRNSRQKERFIYAGRMADWRAQFSRHFVMRPMVRDRLFRKSVVWDFVQAAFGEDTARASVEEGTAANESLCLEDLMLLKEVQTPARHRGRPLRIMLGWEIARLVAEEQRQGPRTKPALHRSLAEQIRKDYLEDAEQMDRLYFPDDPVFVQELDRAVDEAIPEAQSTRPEDYFGPDMLAHVRVLARLVDEMLDNDKGNWSVFLRDRRHDAQFGPVTAQAVPEEEDEKVEEA